MLLFTKQKEKYMSFTSLLPVIYTDLFVSPKRIASGAFDFPSAAPISFHDDNGHRYMTMDLPGYEPEEISVEIERDVLYIEAHHETKDADGKVWSHTNVSESVSLPKDIDQDSLTADLRNGRLTVTFVRKPVEQPAVKKFVVRTL